MNIKLELFKEHILTFTFSYIFSFRPILLFLKGLNYLYFPFIGKFDTYFIYSLLLVLLLISLIIMLPTFHKKFDVIFFFVFLLSSFIISYIFFPENRSYLFTEILDYTYNPVYLFLIYAFPSYVLIRFINNFNLLIKYFYIFSIFVIYSSIFYYFIFRSIDQSVNYMSFSYGFLIHLVFIMNSLFYKFNFLNLFTAILGFIIIFLGGARGPLLISLLTVFTYFIFKDTKTFHTLRKILIFGILALIFFFSIDFIIILLIQISDFLNIDSRTLTFILNGGFLDDNNRFFLFKKTIESFSIFGSGIFGDRVVLDGTYPHNLFLELISHYGFIFGPFLIFLLLVNLLKGLFKENSSVKFFFISLLSIGFYKTIITGTYITEPGFYALIGILVCFANHKSSYLKVKYKNEISKGSFQF